MRRFIVLLALAASSALAACGSDGGTNPAAGVTGTWNLSTVNGTGLPFVLQTENPSTGDPKVEILSDQLLVSANGTFNETTVARFTSGTSVTTQTVPDAGTYTLNGTAVSFVFSSGGSATATVSGNNLTIAESGISLVFVRQ